MSELMRLALVQAGRAVKEVYPYPGVGVVIAEKDRVVSLSFNDAPGKGRHAEIKALDEARTRGADLRKCVLYTNLEPCVNLGLTESCVAAILRADIREVHIAIEDPYHLVRGQGVETLKQAHIKVVVGEMKDEAAWQNKRYLERFCCHCGWPIVD